MIFLGGGDRCETEVREVDSRWRFAPRENSTMTDMTTDIPKGSIASYGRLTFAQMLVLLVLACGCWVAVNEATAQDRCRTTLGRLAVHLKLDSHYSGCRCMKGGVLDFGDPCNTALGVAVGVI